MDTNQSKKIAENECLICDRSVYIKTITYIAELVRYRRYNVGCDHRLVFRVGNSTRKTFSSYLIAEIHCCCY
jgi:hypothetical protein